jgi:LuxR family maltose regulon positive regulatory protein
MVSAERAWLSLIQGQLTGAISWADEVAADIDGLEFPHEPEALMLARVRRAQGAAGDVVPMLERMAARAEQNGRGSSVIAIQVQLALARHESGDMRRGLEALESAVQLAEPAGHVRVFVDEGNALLPLLRKLVSGQSATYVARLLRATGGVGDQQHSAGEIMTPRELEVLHLLARGLSNRAIAERLITSEATVKSHVHRLISKLGVTSRAQVVVRAHQIGLLDGSAEFTIPTNRGA